MATRCAIAIENEDGSFRAIYCHWDGYPKGVGAVLKEHYTTPEKINKLLDLGDISSLGSEPIGEWCNYPKEPTPGYCETYRERGEKNVDAMTFASHKEMERHYDDMCCEYVYTYYPAYDVEDADGYPIPTGGYHVGWFYTELSYERKL